MKKENSFVEEVPEDIEGLKKLALDRNSYKNRLEAVNALGSFKCRQSIDVLWRLMMNDKVNAVQHQAFLKLQAFGEQVRLPKKQKGKLIKDIDKKLARVQSLLTHNFTPLDFNAKFQELYPEAFDVYSFEKKGNFDKWVENVLSSLPKK